MTPSRELYLSAHTSCIRPKLKMLWWGTSPFTWGQCVK